MNTYKVLFGTAFLLITSVLQAQPRGDREAALKQRIETARISFLTQQMDLTPQEAQKFWPVYNQYRKELESILGKKNALNGEEGDLENLDGKSEAEIEKSLKVQFDRQRKTLDLRERFYEQFRGVLSAKKLAQFYQAEIEFQKRLIRRLAEQKQQGRRGN